MIIHGIFDLDGTAVEQEYTKLVTRKCLVAAAARIMDPGIKWDHVPVFYGPGASSMEEWTRALFMGNVERLESTREKTAASVANCTWCVYLRDLDRFSSRERMFLKPFITRRKDTFRPRGERSMITRHRSSVFWGSITDPSFIAKEDNRRFLYIHIPQMADPAELTEYHRRQLWAEAKELFERGEKLYFTPDEEELISLNREIVLSK